MNLFESKNWSTGTGRNQNFAEVLTCISDYFKKNKKIFIGSDSFMSRGQVCFVTAACLLSQESGNRYFFYKESTPSKKYNILSVRITEEVRRSVELAEFLLKNNNILPESIELHLDVSPFASKEGTSKFSEMLKGYVQGYGFLCKLKPNAWASQSVADRHSK